jgi:hypothetical protein
VRVRQNDFFRLNNVDVSFAQLGLNLKHFNAIVTGAQMMRAQVYSAKVNQNRRLI